MAAFNFPNSPNTNDTHTENGISFKWDGTVWKRVSGTGAQGPTGSTGSQGATGPTGAQGQKGAQAYISDNAPSSGIAAGDLWWDSDSGDFSIYFNDGSGSQWIEVGSTGPTGPTGSTGAQGATGPTGAQGATGATGAQGATAAAGAQGTAGAQGATGSTGAQGAAGAQGHQGNTGDDASLSMSTGAPSSPDAGDLWFDTDSGILAAYYNDGNSNQWVEVSTGPIGAQGATGPTGAQGATGTTGAQGATGSTGPTGNTGATGAQGAAGAQGATGSTGAQGALATINSNTNNYVVTATGTANTLQGESGLTYDGSKLQVNSQIGIGGAPDDYQHLQIKSANPRFNLLSSGTNAAKITFGDSGDSDPGTIEYQHSGTEQMKFAVASSEKMNILSTGQIQLQNGSFSSNVDCIMANGGTLEIGAQSTMKLRTATNEVLRLTSDGKVGVNYAGTPPSETMMISSSSSTSALSVSHLSGGNRYGFRLSTISGTNEGMTFASFFNSGYTNHVRIHGSGQVSLGHDSYLAETHGAKLVVHPNIHDSSAQSIGILVDGDAGTGGGVSQPAIGIKIVNTNTWNNATHQYGLYNEVGQQYVASGTGVYNKVSGLYGTTTGYHIELNKNNNAYTNGYGLSLNIKPTGSGGTNYFIYCQKDDSNLKMRVLQNGNLQNANNSYGSTSDVKLKENIVDANSQWDDIKSLRVRNFNFKDDPDKIKMLGVVAQEAEVVSAGLVESDNDIEVDETTGEGKVVGTTKFVKYSILYMKAVKCLQEAQARIESLEAKVSALEGS